MARETIEALLGTLLPADWTDQRAVLIGTGRTEPDAADCQRLGDLASKLPVLG